MARAVSSRSAGADAATLRRRIATLSEAPPARRSRLIDEFEEKAAGCTGLGDLALLLEAVAAELGFPFYALLHHSSLRGGAPGRLRIDNYPVRWERELRERHPIASDPIHAASGRTAIGFAWSALGELVTITPPQRRILERSRYHGIGDGFTVPANIPGEPAGSCSFAVRAGRSLPAGRLLCAEQIGGHAFQVARRLGGYVPRLLPPPHLSPRQLQCLRLLAAGKTDWEAAAILGIANETVRAYVKSARAAYDVVSRTQLVVHGLRDALISFDEAIPPSG